MKKDDALPPRTTDAERATRRSARIKSLLHATANVATVVAMFLPLWEISKHPVGMGD
jgi:hypothetical protein